MIWSVAISIVLLLVLVVASVITDRALARASLENAVNIEVTGHQWWWEINYYGDSPSDNFTAANELHVPVGRPVVIRLKAADVIHSLWVPSLAGKKDLIPGRTTTMSFRADQPGRYRGQCAEFCGYQHAFMAFEVIADPPAQFDAWVTAQKQPAPDPVDADGQARPGGVPAQRLHHVPRDRRHDRRRPPRPRPEPPRRPHDARRRHAAEPARRARALDRQPAGLQARLQHAGDAALERRHERAGLVPRNAEMTTAAALHPRLNSVPPTAEDAAALERAWRDPPGLAGWLSAINHKSIGKRFIVTAFAFFVLGGLLAAAMRLQLARPDNHLIGPDLYNQIFTMHGTTMMFLFAVPVMQAMSVYLVPLMIGTRSVAFPRMNAYAYWVFLFGGVMLFVAFALNIGPDAGWFSYVPLAGPDYSPGKRVDFWAQMITFTELSGLLEAVILITTVFKLRAPGHVAQPHAAVSSGACW